VFRKLEVNLNLRGFTVTIIVSLKKEFTVQLKNSDYTKAR